MTFLHDHELDSVFHLNYCKPGVPALCPVKLHQQKRNGKEPNPMLHTALYCLFSEIFLTISHTKSVKCTDTPPLAKRSILNTQFINLLLENTTQNNLNKMPYFKWLHHLSSLYINAITVL